MKLVNKCTNETIVIQNEEEKFFNTFHQLDMDNSFEVQKLAINFRKWANWNKGEAIIDVYHSFKLDTIVVIHNLFDETKISNSWDFLKDVISILSEYADTDERWNDMTQFWNERTI